MFGLPFAPPYLLASLLPALYPPRPPCVNYINALPCLGLGAVRVLIFLLYLYSIMVGSQFPSQQRYRASQLSVSTQASHRVSDNCSCPFPSGPERSLHLSCCWTWGTLLAHVVLPDPARTTGNRPPRLTPTPVSREPLRTSPSEPLTRLPTCLPRCLFTPLSLLQTLVS